MITPSQQDFIKLSKKGNLIPVYKEILGDLETPVSAYFKVCDDSKYSCLLESVEGEEKVSRFSFIAQDPEFLLQTKGNQAVITRFSGRNPKKEKFENIANPLHLIRDCLSKYKFVTSHGLPPFCGGLVGYLSYDMVRFFEKLPCSTTDDLKLPDTLLMMAKSMLIFDHRNHKIKIVVCVELDEKDTQAVKAKKYQKAIRAIDQISKKLSKPLDAKHLENNQRAKKTSLRIASNMTQTDYQAAVKKAKKYIHAGDIIQAVLSQRFSVRLKSKPFDIYRTLRAMNPSPYMYYLKFDDIQIVGSSPELLVRCQEGVVETRPIAGTRPRGKTEEEDQALAEDLLADPKEKAEHIMLVDLGRNDLGRVCQTGSVYVSEFMKVERYSHVMHIVSNVKGRLKKGNDGLDVLQATFPAGTLSGAPKIRAMEIIDELETHNRGPYGGCIGYFSFSGDLDTCITIRTIIIKGKKAYIQAGAGIVADSVPKTEFQETVNKAQSSLKAIRDTL